ncbi:MAG: site-2 protease family protein [Clostridia bacterium]|nr:site-2 protease family protein [Clostridia bacterium]
MRFTIGKTKIRITFFFAAGMALFALWRGGAVVLCVLSAVFVHECTHLLCLYLCKAVPAELTVGLFGMRLSDEMTRLLPYRKELLCTVSAPLVNFVFSLLLLPLLRCGEVVQTLFAVHFSLGFFNLLPLRCLDGGRSLLCFLHSVCPPPKSEHLMNAIEWVFFLLFFLFLGIYFFTVRFEPTALVFLFYLSFLLFFRK